MLNTTSNYALRAVGYLASLNPERKADSVEISEATGVPRRFLLKILNALRIQRILDATRGIGGGYWLAKSPDSITMYEVIQLFENMQRLGNCPLGGEVCDSKDTCPFHDGWVNVREAFIEFLKTSSFAGFTGLEFKNRFPNFPGPL